MSIHSEKRGVLYLCATPIGNLEDITLRVLRTLKDVDIIAAESVTRCRKLLSHYDIHSSLVGYREKDRESRGRYLLDKLLAGKNVALVSDAGIPGISDPGEHLVKLCRDNAVSVIILPGPSAVPSAVVISGFSTARFVFEGFLPRKKSLRKERLVYLAGEERTVVFFEAPHRFEKTLGEMNDLISERKLCVVRELTKKFEEVSWGSSSEYLKRIAGGDFRLQGEITIVMEGVQQQQQAVCNELTIEEHMRRYLDEGLSLKDAAKEVSRARKISRREAYEEGLRIRGKNYTQEHN